MIFTVTLNPACDRTVIIERFHLDQVNRVSESRRDPGGKSINVSKVIRALGGESVATGLLGGETGDYIASALEKMGIRQRFVRVSAPTRTNLKIVDPIEGTYTDVNDSGEPAAQADIDRVLELLLEVERHHIDPHVGGRAQRIEAVAVQRAHKLVLAGIAVVEQVEEVLCHASLLWFRFPTGLGARLGVGVWA